MNQLKQLNIKINILLTEVCLPTLNHCNNWSKVIMSSTLPNPTRSPSHKICLKITQPRFWNPVNILPWLPWSQWARDIIFWSRKEWKQAYGLSPLFYERNSQFVQEWREELTPETRSSDSLFRGLIFV